MTQEDREVYGKLLNVGIVVTIILLLFFWKFILTLLGCLLGIFLLIWIPCKIYKAKHPVLTDEERANVLKEQLHSDVEAVRMMHKTLRLQTHKNVVSYFKNVREEEYRTRYSVKEKCELDNALADADSEILKECISEKIVPTLEFQLDDNGWFDVILVNVGPHPKSVIKALEEYSIEIFDSPWEVFRRLPYWLAGACTKRRALKLKAAFEAIGATIEIKTSEELGDEKERFTEEIDEKVEKMSFLTACDIAKACTTIKQEIALDELESLILDKAIVYRVLSNKEDELSSKLARKAKRSPEYQRNLKYEMDQVKPALRRLTVFLKRCIDLHSEMMESIKDRNDYSFEKKCECAGLDSFWFNQRLAEAKLLGEDYHG